MYNILVCDDDHDIVNALSIYLSAQGYQVIEAFNGQQAIEAVAEGEIHLIVMDIMMPGLDGIAATAKIREGHNIPIILLTAKSEDSDKVLGLDIGADDYVTKPFNPAELIARVRSQLRRYTDLGGLPKTADHYIVGGIELNDSEKTVSVDGEPVALTPTEYSILRLLMQNPGKVYSTRQIYELVWNEVALGSEDSVAVHIRHIRSKIEIDPSNPRYLKVVWGLGYKIEKEAAHG